MILQTILRHSASDIPAILEDEGLSDDGSVDYKALCTADHGGICGEFLSFFDDDVAIGSDGEVLFKIAAAKSDGILSVAFNKERSEVKLERIMGNDEHPHNMTGFKLLEDDMAVFFPSIGKTIPLTGIFRNDGYESVALSNIQSTDFAGIGEAT